MKLVRRILISTVILVGGAASATANTITPTFLTAVDQGDGTFLWTYSASLSNGRLDDDGFAADQFFTIYDIAGYVSGSVAASSGDWTASDPLLGVTPVGQVGLVTDLPAIANVSFQYTSTVPVTASGLTTIVLGTFTFLSEFGAVVEGDFASQDISLQSPNAQGASGNIAVPFDEPTTVPDGGSTMAFLGLAMLAVGTLRNRFRG